MKTCILISIIAGLFCWNTFAQTTADDWISQGRADLAARDIGDASAAFTHALTLAPTNETANVFYAITRLLTLPSQPAGSNFLTRLGLPVAGRDIYDWSSVPPQDGNGLLLAPAGVNASEFTSQLRTNVLPVISGAISNLLVTDTNFALSLTSSETTAAAVTVDYGDFKLIQAGLYGAEYFIYTLNAQNFDAQLTAIRALATNGNTSVQEVLRDYPQLLTFATTNDLQNARAAFTNAVNTYLAASAFISSRPTNEVRLFNYDKVSAQGEANFRLVLQDLKNSLVAGPQILAVNPNLTVDLAPQFAGGPTWRDWLPKFDGNAIELGSLPDATFGGVIYGLSREQLESALSHRFVMLPVGAPPKPAAGHAVQLAFTTLQNHYYALEVSTNLMAWQVTTNLTATNSTTVLLDVSPAADHRFYRLRDDTGFLTFGGVVLDQNTGSPVAGAHVVSLWDGTSTLTDNNGQFYLGTTLPASIWYEDELEISAPGHLTVDHYYYGDGLVTGLQIYLSP